MKELFPSRDSLANKISYYHLLFFLASLPFDRFYSHLILISLIIHTLIHFNKQQVKPVFKWRTLVLQSVFFITVFSTIYSINRPVAFDEWGKQITILLFPLVFCLNPLDLKKYREALLFGFSLVCTATIAYLYLSAILTVRHYQLPLSVIFSSHFVNHNFSEPIDMHATFLSMQVVIALVYLSSILINERIRKYQIFYGICALILLSGLIQLGSKSIFFCLFILINLAIPLFLLNGKRRTRFMLITAIISIAAVVCLFKLSSFRERYITDLESDLTESHVGEVNDSRLARWGAAVELIEKSPVIGYGAGSEVELLEKIFYEKKYYNSFLHKLNAHNQYLSFLLKSGIIGLLGYLATLFAGFKMALARKDLLFFTVMLLIAIVSTSENLLDVDKGIIFYAFFFSFFVFSSGNGGKAVNKVNTV